MDWRYSKKSPEGPKLLPPPISTVIFILGVFSVVKNPVLWLLHLALCIENLGVLYKVFINVSLKSERVQRVNYQLIIYAIFPKSYKTYISLSCDLILKSKIVTGEEGINFLQ